MQVLAEAKQMKTARGQALAWLCVFAAIATAQPLQAEWTLWQTSGDLPLGTFLPAAAQLMNIEGNGTDFLHLFGGQLESGAPQNTMYRLNLVTREWMLLDAPDPVPQGLCARSLSAKC